MNRRSVQISQEALRLTPVRRRRYWREGLTIVALSVILASGVFIADPGVAHAQQDGWDVDGQHGELHVFGALTEGACRLDMESAWQDVDLGATPSSSLRRPGDEGTPVTFHLQLRDCGLLGGNQRDSHLNDMTWDALQPVVSVSFSAMEDQDVPELVGLRGVSGVGLRLRDSEGRDVTLDEKATPHFVTPANDELIYTVTPERTKAPLTMGDYLAVVNFRLNYD